VSTNSPRGHGPRFFTERGERERESGTYKSLQGKLAGLGSAIEGRIALSLVAVKGLDGIGGAPRAKGGDGSKLGQIYEAWDGGQYVEPPRLGIRPSESENRVLSLRNGERAGDVGETNRIEGMT
jgi:hypothetical protein